MNTLLRGLSTVSTQCVPVTTTTSSGCNGQHAPEIHSSEAPVTSIEERTVTQVTVNRVRGEGLEGDVNERDKFLTKVFFEAVEKEVIGLVRSLIEQGVDVNTKDNRGQTALHYAAKKKNLEVVEYLVLQGADVNAKNDSGEMPLHWAVRWARVEVVRFLVEQKADVMQRVV